MLRSDRTTITLPVIALLLAVMVITLLPGVSAHDIPNDVMVQIFVKPNGERLRLLVRVPLKSLRDVDFPKRGPGYLDLASADVSLRDAATLWVSGNVDLYEGETRIPNPVIAETRVSLESDRSFAAYDEALAHITGPRLANETEIYWNQAMLDILFEYPIHSDASDFSIRAGMGRLGLRVVTVLRFLPPGGAVRAFEFTGDAGLIRLDPRWFQAAVRFVEAGFFHILGGIDHLLFLFCLVIPLRRLRPLIVVVTSFTLAHSIILIASAYNFAPGALWFPPLIETLIAISILYMALENIVVKNVSRRWMIAFGFGLVHGFGFSFALRESLQFAGSHLLLSLLSFNIGVELGQLLVLLLLIPLLGILFRYVLAERIGIIILSALVAHTGWHWMIERGTQLSQFELPELNASLAATAMRWLTLFLILVVLVWLVSRVIIKRADEPNGRKSGRVREWESGN
ncbi:MAG: HupE/UreJ family protein [Acidobacteria bacterium]|nr:HupE/UreJ family protein [Acidobacteriota bacterium]